MDTKNVSEISLCSMKRSPFLGQKSSVYIILWKSVFGLLLIFAGTSSIPMTMSTHADDLSHGKSNSPAKTLSWPLCIEMTRWEDFLNGDKGWYNPSTPVTDDRRDPHEGLQVLKNLCGNMVYNFELELIEALRCHDNARQESPSIGVLFDRTPPITLAPDEEVKVMYTSNVICQICCQGHPFRSNGPYVYGKGTLRASPTNRPVFTEDYHIRPTIIEGLAPQPDSYCGLQFEGHFISLKKVSGEMIWLNPRFPDHA